MNIDCISKDKPILVLGHDNPDVDSLVSGYLFSILLREKGFVARFAIPSKIEDDELQLCLKYDFDPSKFIIKKSQLSKNYNYVLVDHNEHDLPGEIVAIIDHHPFDEENIKCNNYYIRKATSTSCMVCEENEKVFNKSEIKLACLAAFVDTASFHSIKTVDEDVKWVKSMCNKFNFNYEKLFKDGLCLTDITDLKKASLNGVKTYYLDEKRIDASFIQLKHPLDHIENIHQMIDFLAERRVKEDYFMHVFIVYNMDRFWTTYYLIKDGKVQKHVSKNYLSRGSNIMKQLEKELSN